jgi:ribose 5-phosphate isomerase B
MKLFIGADHNGHALAMSLLEWAREQGQEAVFLGNTKADPNDDYVDFAVEVARKVAEEPETKGVVICGSGVGVDIAANKISGVRSCLGHSVEMVKSARNDDDVNVLSLGSDFTTEEAARGMVKTFLTTPFAGEERYQRRLEKVKQLER